MADQAEPQWAADVLTRMGRRVAALRRERGLSAQQLANLTARVGHEVPRAAIAKLENGHRGVTVPEMLVLAKALDVPPWALIADLAGDAAEANLPGDPEHPWHFVQWWRGDVFHSASGDWVSTLGARDIKALEHWHEFERLWQTATELDAQWLNQVEIQEGMTAALADVPDADAEKAAEVLKAEANWLERLRADLDDKLAELRVKWAREVQATGRSQWAADLGRPAAARSTPVARD